MTEYHWYIHILPSLLQTELNYNTHKTITMYSNKLFQLNEITVKKKFSVLKITSDVHTMYTCTILRVCRHFNFYLK